METPDQHGECIGGDVVHGSADASNRCYCLNPDTLRELRELTEGLEQRACC